MTTMTVRPPPRVALGASGSGSADTPAGVWWPYSRHLTRELPHLLLVLHDRRSAGIDRATVHRAMWPFLPCRVRAEGRIVHLDWSRTEQSPHEIHLLSREAARWNLLVVPPETAPDVAARIMAAASTRTGLPAAAALIAASGGAGGAQRQWWGGRWLAGLRRRRDQDRAAPPTGRSGPVPRRWSDAGAAGRATGM